MAYLVVATAGHIDHGKSALVQALTGTDPDRLKAEKERGITIELGFAHATIGETTVAFVDVPGHERFVKTMLAGVGGVDAVALIVAADESVMPQTREHFDICRLLHVPRGLIVLTKSDLVDAPTLDLVTLDVRQLVAGSFLENAPVLPVSAKTGAGLEALRTALADLSIRAAARETGAPRLPIDRVFSMTGFGTVVTGTLQSGVIRVDDELLVLPGGRPVRVRGLHVHGRAQSEVGAPHRVAVNLAGVEVADIARGQTLAAPGVLSVTRRVDAEMDVLPTAHALRHGERVRFHSGTADAFGRLVLSANVLEIAAGQRALVRVRLESPVAVTRGDRFILRSASHAMTVAGGRILDPDPSLKAPRSADAQTRLASLAGPAGDLGALATMVMDRGPKGMALADLATRGGVEREQVSTVAAALERGQRVSRAGDRLVAANVVLDLTQKLVALVSAFHQRSPLADGLPREEARERLFARADPAVFDLVLSRLSEAGTLAVRDRLSLTAHVAGLSTEERRTHEMLERVYRDAGLTPPEPSTLVRDGVTAAAIGRMVDLMVRQKTLVRTGGLIFHPDVLADLKRNVQEGKLAPDQRTTVDVGTFKQRYGVSRKFAIPLLEWLDRERVTRRVGDVRLVL
jgi:selenocysteine-specific elongation factor